MIDVAQHQEIMFVSIAMERWQRRNITGHIPQSLVEKQNVNVRKLMKIHNFKIHALILI